MSPTPSFAGRWFRLVLAPFWAGLGAALSAAVPPAGILLVPLGAARLGRSVLDARVPDAFAMAALSVPVALVLGRLVAPAGILAAPLLAAAFIALPALALLAGARGGRRRDALFLLVFAATGIGALAIVLAFAVSTGRDPGAWLAARFEDRIPEMIGFYRTAGWEESSIEAAARVFRAASNLLGEQLPGLALAGSMLFAAFLVYPLGRLWGVDRADLTEVSFGRFSTPLVAAALFVPAGLLAALGPEELRRPALDVLIPLGVLFFLRGLAIIRALLDRGRVNPFLRAFIYVVVFQGPLILVLALGGLLDEFVDLRSRVERWAARKDDGPNGP
jgi:hypothetical protein